MADYDLNSLLEYADMMHVDREDAKKFHEYTEEEHRKKAYDETVNYICSLSGIMRRLINKFLLLFI